MDAVAFRMVIAFLGFVGLTGIVLMGVLAIYGKEAPQGLVSITSGAVSSFATLLIRPPVANGAKSS